MEQIGKIEQSKYQETYVMLKPDVLPRRLVGTIVAQFQKLNLTLLHLEMTVPTLEMLERHYEEHKGKAFYDNLIKFIVQGPVIKMALGGPNAIATAR